jgi:hypothetical protein
VQFERSLYSVPFRLIGQSLWLKAGANLVSLYQSHQLVATHPRALRAGARMTQPDHLPPDALAWSLVGPQQCLAAAERIGPRCRQLIEALFADRVLDKLRAAQGIVRLAKVHGDTRVEAACARAIEFGDPRYRTVKTILARGLDQRPALSAATLNSEIYTHGGRFCRAASDAVH